MIVIAGLAALLAAATLAAFFGKFWWPLDLVANFRPQLGVSLAAVAVLCFLAKRTRIGWVALVAGLVNLGLVAVLFVPNPAGSAPSGDEIRVLSFNLFAQNESYPQVIEYIRQTGADVVFLHEASLPWDETLAAADLGYRIVRTHTDTIFGSLVLVKGEATVEGFGFGRREPRAAAVSYVTESGVAVAILGIHPLAPVTSDWAGLRDAQFRFAETWAAEQAGPAIVTGDFNATPWSYVFRRFELNDSERGFGLQPSFPATRNLLLRVPIDHLLHSDHLVVLDRVLGPALGSDHFPLVVDLALVAPPA